MTLGNEDVATGARGGSNTPVPSRDTPVVHRVDDAPLCDACQKQEFSFFDPGCPGCFDILLSPSTTISEIFAIIRQWTPQAQQNFDLLVNEIFKRGAHVDDRDGLTDMTMLQYAAKAGASGVGDIPLVSRVVTQLIDKGADVHIRCRWTHMTALHYAVYFDVGPVVTLLLKASKGLDIENPCNEFDNGTPLHIAAMNLACEVAEILLQHGASVEAKDAKDRIPLECIPDSSEFESTSPMSKMAERMNKLLTGPVNQAKTPPPNYDSVHGKVTLQAMGLRLGDKVVVGGLKAGYLRYCGPTEFASGIWAGIELEEPDGKNDGRVGGISYFKCSPKHGIFAPISKIAKPGMTTPRSGRGTPTHRRRTNYTSPDVSKVTAKVDSGLRRSRTPSDLTGEVEFGDRVRVAGQRKGTVRYIGEPKFAQGTWYGIELDRPVGKNDGSVNGERYFTCKPKHGVFAPLSRIQKLSSSFMGSNESLDSLGGVFSPLTSGHRSRSNSQSSINSTGTPTRSRTPTGHRKSPRSLRSPGRHRRPWSGGTAVKRTPVTPSGVEFRLTEGMSVFCNNELGIVKYIGPTDFADGIWLGVELRTPKGKNDGFVNGKRYFVCRQNHGLLVRPSRVTVRGINGAKLLGDLSEFK